MPVPFNIPARSLFLAWFCHIVLVVCTSLPLLARGPDPSFSIPLEPLGFQPLSTQFLLAGSSMLTLHHVDNEHLLLTFSTRRLMKRLPEEPPDDQDRYVEAVLLELPSGRLLGRTSWRLHDHGQYLWNLGRGHFLLRIRNTLTTFSPLVNLPRRQPFRERPFISTDRRIDGVLLSPDADLLIVETSPLPDASTPGMPSATPTPQRASSKPDGPAPVQFSLFRLFPFSGSGDDVVVQPAGSVRARAPGRIPANGAGYLALIDQGRQQWAFNFNSYDGKVNELAPFASSCRPSPLFVSRSEFVAFGCHGGQAARVIGGFNMKGEQMWEQTFVEPYTAATFSYAPAGGRFAISRILTHLQVSPSEPLAPEMIASQSVVVYQTDSGKQILRVETLPVQRAGQNFSLSPDGMNLAVIHGDAIQIYRLPPLTSKEQEAVNRAQTMVPQQNDTPIRFSGLSGTSSAADSSDQLPSPRANSPPALPTPDNASSSPTQNPTPDAAAAAPPAPADTPSSTVEATPQEQPRKPPTLYNSPGDPPRPVPPK